MLAEDAGLDVSSWEGIEALGYAKAATIETTTPDWFPFTWMPAVRRWRGLNPVYVYDRIVDQGSE
jgi:hypothetical protein